MTLHNYTTMLAVSYRESLPSMAILVLFICSFLLSYNRVEGSMSLSTEEVEEIKNQLKFLNKPSNKSIKTQYGDIYDCVDFYKQPAFDHPLLKNHDFHPGMRPSYTRKGLKRRHSSMEKRSSRTRLEGGGCPFGTVPIRRITKEDLIREKLASKTRSLAVDDYSSPRTHYAIARTKPSPSRFGGAGGALSAYNLSVDSRSYSAARFKLSSGPDAIQVGWRVDPTLYGDTQTRFYIYTDAGQSHCFNTRCPGFIIVNTDYPLDGVLATVTKPGGTVYEAKPFIVHDPPSGNWWLDYGEDFDTVGFWPKRIFTGLGDLAFSVEWGGEVYSPEGWRNPPMGSGNNPYSKFENYRHYIAYFRRMVVINEQSETVDANDIELYSNSDTFYAVRDMGDIGGIFRHLITYGGSGCTDGDPPNCYS